jgi:hypothetical protein
MVFFGSPYHLTSLPTPIVATSSMDMAFLLLAPWEASSFTISYVYNKIFLQEKYEGAVEQVFKGKSGYIYSLEEKPFARLDEEQFLAFTEPRILFSHYIPDAYAMIKNNQRFIIGL